MPELNTKIKATTEQVFNLKKDIVDFVKDSWDHPGISFQNLLRNMERILSDHIEPIPDPETVDLLTELYSEEDLP